VRPWWSHGALNSAVALAGGLPIMLTADRSVVLMVLLALALGFVMIPVTQRWERKHLAGREGRAD
jgi:hypothetical protein